MEFSISEFNGEAQQLMLSKLKTEYLSTGKYIRDQRSISPKIMSSVLLAGGAAGTTMSAKMSSVMFMATADPSTLMRIGSGFGDAVLGASGIVRHAPFIPIPGSIPVVAPLMAMQAMSSMIILQQFNAMDKKLNTIKETIDRLLTRQEVTKLAELFSAVRMVDELYEQYNQAGNFSTDMLIRLALVERDTMILSKRYEILENTETSTQEKSIITSYDASCTMLASFANLRVKYLRTCVDVQENPQFVQRSTECFMALLKEDISLWNDLLHKSDKLKNEMDEFAAEIERYKGIQRLAQIPKEKELARKKDEYTAAMEKERWILKDFHALIDVATQISETTCAKISPTLIYWRDEDGEHCFATNEQVLETA